LKKALGWLLSTVAWIAGAFIVIQAVVYAFGCVVFLHAPVGPVLLVTSSGTAVLLAAAWACARLGASLRQTAASATAQPEQR
jgi:hypothetical protein